MNNEASRARVEKLISQYGCLPDAPSGARIERFNAKELAHALEQEINRATLYGHSKITLHMDIPDAAALARELRRGK